MRRSLFLIAVAAAVATAGVVVIVGMSSGDGAAAGTPDATSSDALPSGHPSVTVDATPESAAPEPSASETAEPAVDDELARLEQRRAEKPSDVEVLLDLADAYFVRQRLQEAERAYGAALVLQPDGTAAQVGLALVWHAQGDSKRAETELRTVLSAHPGLQDAHYSLAIVYFSSGRVDKAKQEWETAARLDPTSLIGRRSRSFTDLLEDSQSSSPQANQ